MAQTSLPLIVHVVMQGSMPPAVADTLSPYAYLEEFIGLGAAGALTRYVIQQRTRAPAGLQIFMQVPLVAWVESGDDYLLFRTGSPATVLTVMRALRAQVTQLAHNQHYDVIGVPSGRGLAHAATAMQHFQLAFLLHVPSALISRGFRRVPEECEWAALFESEDPNDADVETLVRYGAMDGPPNYLQPSTNGRNVALAGRRSARLRQTHDREVLQGQLGKRFRIMAFCLSCSPPRPDGTRDRVPVRIHEDVHGSHLLCDNILATGRPCSKICS